jgi:hypothetical protein
VCQAGLEEMIILKTNSEGETSSLFFLFWQLVTSSIAPATLCWKSPLHGVID